MRNDQVQITHTHTEREIDIDDKYHHYSKGVRVKSRKL